MCRFYSFLVTQSASLGCGFDRRPSSVFDRRTSSVFDRRTSSVFDRRTSSVGGPPNPPADLVDN